MYGDLLTVFPRPTPVYSIYPQKAAVIIDGGYWEILRKEIGNPDIDLIELSEELCRPAYRLRTYYFDGKDQARQPIHDSLKLKDRFEVILGDVVKARIKCPKCGKHFTNKQQKRVDMLIAVKMAHLASTKQVDMIVLIAGDRDFLPVVEEAKSAGSIIKLAYGIDDSTGVGSGLKQEADETILLSKEFLQRFVITEPKVKKEPKKVEIVSEIEAETIDEVISNLIELMVKNRTDKINASDLGAVLNEKNIVLGTSLKEIAIYAKNKIGLIEEENLVFLTLVSKKDKIKVATLRAEEDPAIELMLESIRELLKEKEKDRVTMIELGWKMAQKIPDWKLKFGLPKKKSLLTTIKRAENYIITEEVENKLLIGLKNLKD